MHGEELFFTVSVTINNSVYAFDIIYLKHFFFHYVFMYFAVDLNLSTVF